MDKRRDRESNVELLRILSMLGVIILHYNNKSIGGGLQYVQVNSINYYILMLLESISICAVNLFMLISGFYSYNRNRVTLRKPLSLIIQVELFSLGWTLATGLIKGNLTLNNLLYSIVPANYFVVLYIVVYLLSPYLNLIFDKINRRFIILLLCIFSVYPTFVECFNLVTGHEWMGLSSIGMYGSQYGYSIVNFIMMYLIGLYIRKREDAIDDLKSGWLVMSLLVVISVITLWGALSDNLAWNKNLSRIYCNPLVVFEAVIIFVLFKKINIRINRFINNLASASFTVFLVHDLFIRHVGIEWAVNQNALILVIHLLLSSTIIYLFSFVIYLIYARLEKICLKMVMKTDVIITDV